MNTPTNNPNDVQLGVGMDATGVNRAADAIEGRVESMAGKVAQSAQKAGKGVESIGAGGGKAATDLERATRSIIGSIERTTATMQAGERGTAAYFEVLGQQRGISAEVLKPYLEQLRQVEAVQRAASGSMDKMGVSAKQTAAAMRGVPAQFTDIITSLQGGQAPLTVLLQQGGQLKDMFGGIGNAARSLGGYLLGLVNPYTVAAAAAVGLALAYKAGAGEAQAYQSTLILSGQAAGVTASQLSTMAAAVRSIGAGSQGRAAEVLNQLAGLGGVGVANLERFTAAALRLESVGGPAAEETAKAFAALAKDPLAAALKLNEGTNFLTRSVYEQIKALEDQGHHTEAARLAQESYADAVESRTPDLLKNLGSIERGWLSIKKAGKEALDSILDIGRDGGTVGALREAEGRIGPGRRRTYVGEMENIAALEQGAKYEALSAAYTAEQARQVKLLADYRKDELQYLPKIQQYQAAVLKTVNEGVAAGERAEAIQLRVAALKEKYLSGPKPGKSEAQKALEAEAKAHAKAVADAAAEYEKYLGTLDRQTESQEKATQALRDELIAMTAGKEVLAEIIMAREAINLAKADERVLGAASTEEYVRLVAIANTLREQLALRRGIAAAMASKESVAAAEKAAKELTDASAKAAKDAAREWERAAQQIEQTLTDALMRGFESGKSFGQNMRDTIVNLFKTMVLRPVVQMVVSPVASALTSYLGYGQPAGVSGGGAGGSPFSTAAGLGAMGAFGSFGTAFGMGSSLTAAGSIGTALSASGTMIGAGNYAAGFGMGAGALAGPAALAAMYTQQASAAYDQGFRRGQARQAVNPVSGALLGGGFGLYAGLTADVATGLSKLGLSNKWADILSGATVVAKLFGRAAPRVTETGVMGTIGGDGDFTGKAYANIIEKGGVLRSDKKYSRTSALGEDMARYLDDASASVFDKAKSYGQVLGLPAQTLGDITKAIKIKLGNDAEANKTAILEAMASYGDALVAGWAEALKPLSIYGETTAQTVERVAGSLSTVNDVLKQLGLTLLGTSVAGAGSAVALAEAFGGLEVLQQASASYYEKFYSDAERTAAQTAMVGQALGDLGLAMPGTRDQFRALVEAADLTTEAGRTQYATLLGVADAFAQITDSGKDLVAAGKGVADYIAELRGAATGGNTLLSARSVYQADLASARNGDVAATGRIVGDAKALVDAVRAAAADPVALARETSRIAAELQSLPATLTWMGQLQTPAPASPAAPAAQPTEVRSIMPVTTFASTTAASSADHEKLVDLGESLQSGIEAVALNTSKTVKILDRMAENGQTVGWVA